MALAPLKILNLEDLSNMEVVLNSNLVLNQDLDVITNNYHRIDIRTTMRSLENVGQILKLAYAGSKNFPCSETTILILTRYQKMINNTCVSTSSFVQNCLLALKNNKIALKMAEKDEFELSLKFIEKCSKIAGDMAEEAGKLVNEATELSNLSEEALVKAQKDSVTSNEEKEKIEKMIVESKAKNAEMNAKIANLTQKINQITIEQHQLAEKADKERLRAFILKTISITSVPINKTIDTVTNVFSNASIATKAINLAIKGGEHVVNELKEKKEEKDEKEESKVEDKSPALTTIVEQENLYINLKSELEKEEREAYAEIAKSGVLIMGLKTEGNELSASMVALDLANKALGRIRTTFECTRMFWQNIEIHCKNLSNIEILKEFNCSKFKDQLIDELQYNTLSWLALGKINYLTQQAIIEVSQKSNTIMNNLPTKDEALKILQNDADFILKSLML